MWPTLTDIRHRRVAARRRAALAALREADALLFASGGQILVFGSLAEGGFDEDSDIDAAICGLPTECDDQIATKIDTLLRLRGFDCDIQPLRRFPDSLRKRIAANGCVPGALG